MDNPNLPKVVAAPPAWMKRSGPGTMLVPGPRDVEAFIRTVQAGEVVTVSRIRQFLAGKYSVDLTCPLTTGMFIRIAAEAAEDDRRDGKSEVTPYWRVVKDDGSLNPKFPGGVKRQAERLRAKGHRILSGRSGRPPRVAGTEIS